MDDAELTDRIISTKMSINCQLDPNYKDVRLFNSALFTSLSFRNPEKFGKSIFVNINPE
jgi:hypothetical protein